MTAAWRRFTIHDSTLLPKKVLMMAENRKKIAVLGGGITGLTAAYYLQYLIQHQNLPLDVILLEKGRRLGGKIQTIRRDGYIVERGPDSFLARKKSALRLVQDLGLESELVSNATGKSYIILNQQLHPVPKGSVMGIPTKLTPFFCVGAVFGYRQNQGACRFCPAAQKNG
jgi:oxygen-dependent protoporphyrinogen oxidase